MIHLFRVSVPTSVLLLILCDLAILLACHIAALDYARNKDLDLQFYLFEEQGLIRCLIAVGVIQIGLYFADLYESVVLRSNSVLANRFALILGAGFIVQALLGYGQTNLELPQWTMLYAQWRCIGDHAFLAYRVLRIRQPSVSFRACPLSSSFRSRRRNHGRVRSPPGTRISCDWLYR